MALNQYGSSSKGMPSGKTEFDILKASHKFLHEEDKQPAALSWEERLAHKYYSNLYREYAVCDLKHYKSGNFALRWRTETEVISGAGETTCGNTRCSLHSARNIDPEDLHPALITLELPFSYVEDGENKFALVKVVLCGKCYKKLMWKRNKEKEKETRQTQAEGEERPEGEGDRSGSRNEGEEQNDTNASHGKSKDLADPGSSSRRRSHRHGDSRPSDSTRRRSSRSRSPRNKARSTQR
ncbi:hypothetical protein PHLCEN_2v6333 [Hermanssonia centrifuga]|uniref:Protein FRA10AC1 n=1 Tax=Hermanssonia centrifuga TaxID=98765 RepID=A0A2R6P0D3_9APHY|nr:hypothetical protein PHLCEN_2v6333 [Hermanssonia centrifuga]